MKEGLCPHCGKTVELDYTVGFRATCDHCQGDLHVCRACAFHAPGQHNGCSEERAPMVSDKERQNLCEWFQWGDNAPGTGMSEAQKAKAALERLFARKR